MDRTAIAALALSGILGSTDEDGRPLATPELAAREAVAYADALLAELRGGAASPRAAEEPPRSAKGGTPERDPQTAGNPASPVQVAEPRRVADAV